MGVQKGWDCQTGQTPMGYMDKLLAHERKHQKTKKKRQEHCEKLNKKKRKKKEQEGKILEHGFMTAIKGSGAITTDSKALAHVRQCKNCPLRPKERIVRGELILEPAKCSHYNADPKFKCPFGVYDFIARMKLYFDIVSRPDFSMDNLLKALAMDAISATVQNSQLEVAKDGAPGGRTAMYHKVTQEYLKIAKGIGDTNVHVEQTNNNYDLRGAVMEIQGMKKAVEEKQGQVIDAEPVVKEEKEDG